MLKAFGRLDASQQEVLAGEGEQLAARFNCSAAGLCVDADYLLLA
jgi:hypothetical protein